MPGLRRISADTRENESACIRVQSFNRTEDTINRGGTIASSDPEPRPSTKRILRAQVWFTRVIIS